MREGPEYCRRPLVAGNWKMNLTVDQSRVLMTQLVRLLEKYPQVERVICPPYTSLYSVGQQIIESEIALGAQNAFWEDTGAYTGEVSAAILAPLCDYAILGHSERRQYFGETNETVSKRVKACQRHGIKPIVCVGENLEQNEAGLAHEIVAEQLHGSLAGIDDPRGIVVAYEPVWAIGTGKAATASQAEDVIAFVRDEFKQQYGDAAAAAVRILYGGSVNAANSIEYMEQADIDGALVGGASLKPGEFPAIVRLTAEAKGLIEPGPVI